MAIIAIFNLLLLYYVVFNGSFEVDKKYVTDKFQARLPKDSHTVEAKDDEETTTLKPSPSSTLNPLIELMKNKLVEQKENERNASIILEDSSVDNNELDEELKEKLLDSSEILLITKPAPVINPKLYLQSNVINNSHEFLNLMEERVELLRNHCSKQRQTNKVNSQYLYVLKVTLH